ncbi:lipopolysaccharide biosynthesis protein [Pedobacter sp. Du54]|uniref:lipopolysaccharide biosynthesis protein n=1 Tax=Pedobacter anseongensis TaxID=3133439 RepID=UPI0030AA8696
MSLKKRTISGLFWTFSQQFSVQFINFFIQIVLARVLLPSDFGLIAMMTVFMNVGTSLVDAGLTSSLIRTESPDQRDYSTVFFVNLLGSVVIYLLLFIAAPYISNFYNEVRLESIIKVYTLTFIIRAFVGVQTTKLTKEMNFKLQMTMQIPSVVIGGLVGVFLAYKGFGVWSIVWMNLVQSTLFTAQHWFSTGWYPSFVFDLERLKYHFFFGYKLTISGLLDTIYKNIYTLIIGKYFSITELGFYNRANSLRMFPVQNISTALNKVTYPLFSSIQNDDKKLKLAYMKLMQQVLFWITPLLVFLACVAEPFFRLLLTEKWLPAVPYFQLLCISGIMFPLHSYNLNILKVKGRTDLFLKLELIKKFYTTIGIVCCVPFGIYALLYYQIISTVLSFYVNSFYSGKLLNYKMKEQIKDIAPILFSGSISGLVLYLLNLFCIKSLYLPDFAFLLVTALLYSGIYILISRLLKIDALSDFKQLILKR